ncbi:MAG TPA: FAD-binding oxidoreductase [Steroidobacteraceae bacterium]|nr:FAD-binding oxidoreductase [Steroidobacteraceae bacterium]
MGPYVDSVVPDELMPANTSVVVVGGGIVGTFAALTLAGRGIPVVLCEKGYIACEQSSRNWGWCRQAGRDAREMPLIIQSLALWRDMNRLTESDTGYRECGVLYVGEGESDETRFAAWTDMAKPHDIGTRIVRGAELAALMPGASRTFTCGLYVPTDGCAEPQRAAPAIARAAQRKGAIILAHCAVRGIERTGGRAAAVVTERGRIKCDAVVLAGGAWSSLFCANLGIRLPQLKVLASVMRTAPVADGPDPCTYLDEVAYRKRRDGGYTIAGGASYLAPFVPDSLRYLRDFLPTLRKEGDSLRLRVTAQSLREFRSPRHWPLDRPSPFEETRVLDPAPNRNINRRALAAMIRLHSQFRDVPIVQQWAGYIDVTPDVVPYISPVGTLPGLTVATGFSGHGFGIGPAAGRLAAELAIGATPSVDPTPFRASRFSDGSPIVIGPEI